MAAPNNDKRIVWRHEVRDEDEVNDAIWWGIGGFSFLKEGTTFLTGVGIDCESLGKKQPKRYLQLLALLYRFRSTEEHTGRCVKENRLRIKSPSLGGGMGWLAEFWYMLYPNSNDKKPLN